MTETPFRFERRGRETFVYREGDRAVTIYGDMLTGPVAFAFRRKDLFRHWDPPHAAEEISGAQRVILLARLHSYMEATRTPYVLDE